MTEHKPINIPRMRTVKEAAAEIKQLDAHSALTEWRIRELENQLEEIVLEAKKIGLTEQDLHDMVRIYYKEGDR